jgi:hypothetical protein
LEVIVAVGISRADHTTHLHSQKVALTSPTSCGRSVGIVRSRTKATEFIFMGLLDNSGKISSKCVFKDSVSELYAQRLYKRYKKDEITEIINIANIATQ